MIYGISKSKDVLLSSIAGALDEDTKKAYTIDRLSDNLSNDLSNSIDENYCNLAMDSLGENPVFLIGRYPVYIDEPIHFHHQVYKQPIPLQDSDYLSNKTPCHNHAFSHQVHMLALQFCLEFHEIT